MPWLVIFPFGVAIAIFRYRLLEMDAIVNRTIMWGLLTAVLAGVISVSITVLQKIFQLATGEKSDVAVVLTSLILVSVFTPIKTRLQAFLDRRLQGLSRAHPDAARVWRRSPLVRADERPAADDQAAARRGGRRHGRGMRRDHDVGERQRPLGDRFTRTVTGEGKPGSRRRWSMTGSATACCCWARGRATSRTPARSSPPCKAPRTRSRTRWRWARTVGLGDQVARTRKRSCATCVPNAA